MLQIEWIRCCFGTTCLDMCLQMCFVNLQTSNNILKESAKHLPRSNKINQRTGKHKTASATCRNEPQNAEPQNRGCGGLTQHGVFNMIQYCVLCLWLPGFPAACLGGLCGHGGHGGLGGIDSLSGLAGLTSQADVVDLARPGLGICPHNAIHAMRQYARGYLPNQLVWPGWCDLA